MSVVTLSDNRQLDLVKRTVAKDCSPAEFDLFIHTCKQVRLDPLRKQIYAFVMHKDDASKRQLTIVTSIGGYRSIAERTGNYRPGKTRTIIDESLKDQATNPLGVSHAVATVYKYVHGDWHEVEEEAHWSEFAPIKEIWEDRQRTGKFHLDPKKDNWRRMPRVMIEKCAEAKALRRGWPDDFDGLMAEDEIDRAHSIDLTASEMAAAGAQEQRFELIGGKGTLMVDWCDGEPIQRVHSGKFGDQALAFVAKHKEEVSHVAHWENRNREVLKEYWALDKDGALALKKELEKVKARVAEAAE